MHSLVENYGDCGMDEEIEAVKREWWNVVTEEFWGGGERGVGGDYFLGILTLRLFKNYGGILQNYALSPSFRKTVMM